jgi:ankyrin repeat protein
MVAAAAPSSAAWLRAVGGSALAGAGHAVATDGAGNVLLGGGSGGKDAFVTRLSAEGERLYTTSLTASGSIAVNGVAGDSAGNAYVAGAFTGQLMVGSVPLAGRGRSDIFVARLDPAGNVLWAKAFGGSSYEAARALAVDESGNVYLTGTYQRDLDFGGPALDNSGIYDIFLAELDSSGNHVFSKGFGAGGGTETTGVALAVDPSGVCLAGNIDGTINLGGGLLRAADGKSIVVARFSREGKYLRGSMFGGRGDAHVGAIAVDSAGGVMVTGGFSGAMRVGASTLESAGGSDIMLLRLDPSLAPVWGKRFGGTGYDEGRGLAVDRAGGIYLAASVEDQIDLGSPAVGRGKADALVARLDSTGAMQWARRYGSTGADGASAVALDRFQNVIFTGAFTGEIDAGAGIGRLRARGSQDGWALRLGAGTVPPELAAPTPREIATDPAAAAEQASEACAAGDLAAVKALVPSHVPVTAQSKTGFPLVLMAAYKGKAEVVTYLLSQGGDPDTALPSGYTALMQATRWGYLDAVRALVVGHASVNAGDAADKGTALHIAVTEGRKFPAVTAYLLASGARTDVRDSRGRGPLLMAIDAGNDEGARALLDAGAALEAQDDLGHTPLAWASVKGNAAMAAELLKRGAKPDVAAKDGMTPLFHASHGGYVEIGTMLLSRGAGPNPREKKYGDTALMRAANNGHFDMVELLLAHKAQVNLVNDEGLSAAHMAARNGQDTCLAALAKSGANLRLKDKAGHDVAAAAGNRANTAALAKKLTK